MTADFLFSHSPPGSGLALLLGGVACVLLALGLAAGLVLLLRGRG